jgi:lipid-A-disaccharide synthase
MVVIYKLPKIAEAEAKLVGFKIPEFISLPNILLKRRTVPELIQTNATPENLSRELAQLLSDPAARAEQLVAFDELEAMLGGSDAITKTAELALSMIQDVAASGRV